MIHSAVPVALKYSILACSPLMTHIEHSQRALHTLAITRIEPPSMYIIGWIQTDEIHNKSYFSASGQDPEVFTLGHLSASEALDLPHWDTSLTYI